MSLPRAAVNSCCTLALAIAAAVGLPRAAAADPTATTPPRASSFAPHHTRSRVYGAPIQPQILHKRRKRAHAAGSRAGAPDRKPDPASR
jgi:hypothetical protein